jgi:glycogen operon protein
MLTAGDEGGRSQRGNNNAYCQDNEITWVDWAALDDELIAHAAFVSALRKRFDVFSSFVLQGRWRCRMDFAVGASR